MTRHTFFPQELAEEIASGRQVDLFFDNDGTTFPFDDDPSKVKMDKGCFAALIRLVQYPNVKAVSLTGRDVREAEKMLTACDQTILSDKGEILWPKTGKGSPFGIIGSHGVEYMMPGGLIERHDLGPKADRIIADAKAAVTLLKTKYPDLHIETGKHGCVAVNTSLIQNITERQAAYGEAQALLEPLTGESIFQLYCEGAKEMELRPAGFGKDFGIQRFGRTDPDRMTVFFCDSLGDHGTDRPAAKLINTQFTKGRVVMVNNGRDEPPKDPDCTPAHVCKNPHDLGILMAFVLDRISMIGRKPKLLKPTLFQPN